MRNVDMIILAVLILLASALTVGLAQPQEEMAQGGVGFYHLIAYDETSHLWETTDHSPNVVREWYEIKIPPFAAKKVLAIKPRLEFESRGGEWDRVEFEIKAHITNPDGITHEVSLLEDEFQTSYDHPIWIRREKQDLEAWFILPNRFYEDELTVSIHWHIFSHTNNWDNSFYRVAMNGCSVWGE